MQRWRCLAFVLLWCPQTAIAHATSGPSPVRIVVRDLGRGGPAEAEYVGMSVCVAGTLTDEPYPAVRPAQFRSYFENATGGTRLVPDEQYERPGDPDDHRVMEGSGNDVVVIETSDFLWMVLIVLGVAAASAGAGFWFARRGARPRVVQLQPAVRQARKLQALGTLAGGVAHEFSNHLLTINGLTEMSLDRVDLDRDVRHNLRRILEANDRAKKLIEQILAFSRQSSDKSEIVDSAELLADALIFLRLALPASIQLEESIDRKTGRIDVDAGELHQLVLNIGSNAAHAIGDAPGTIGVRLRGRQIDKPGCERLGLAGPGRYVELAVSDTGHGMDPATLERIFEPFFTTKRVGHGTGLGLAVVHSIMHRHSGAIEVDSSPESVSTFRFFFPWRGDASDGDNVVARETTDGVGSRVLFVEDDEQLAQIGSLHMQNFGYEVAACGDAGAALRMFFASPDRFDVVVTDDRMPGKSGLELAREIKARRRDLPILLITGNRDAAQEEIGGGERCVDAVLIKPFRRAQLSAALRRVIGLKSVG